LKSQPRSVPLGTLRDLIHQRGEKLLTQLREGPIGRLIPGAADGKHEGSTDPSVPGEPGSAPAPSEPTPSSEVGKPAGPTTETSARAETSSFEQWRHAVDDRIRMILPSFIGFRDLQQKVEQLSHKVAEL